MSADPLRDLAEKWRKAAEHLDDEGHFAVLTCAADLERALASPSHGAKVGSEYRKGLEEAAKRYDECEAAGVSPIRPRHVAKFLRMLAHADDVCLLCLRPAGDHGNPPHNFTSSLLTCPECNGYGNDGDSTCTACGGTRIYSARAPADPEPDETAFCGKCCDHGSPCLLYADHQPQDRHETQHGCIFYDAAPDSVKVAAELVRLRRQVSTLEGALRLVLSSTWSALPDDVWHRVTEGLAGYQPQARQVARSCPAHGKPLHRVYRCDDCPGMGPQSAPAPSPSTENDHG